MMYNNILQRDTSQDKMNLDLKMAVSHLSYAVPSEKADQNSSVCEVGADQMWPPHMLNVEQN